MRERTWKARRDKLLAEEAIQAEKWWWLSFCDPSYPEGSQFLGAILTRACGFTTAITKTHLLGINPGGECKGFELPDDITSGPEFAAHVGLADQLLSKKDIDEKLGGAAKMPDSL